MGCRMSMGNVSKVLGCIRADDGQIRSNDIARKIGMHPQNSPHIGKYG